MEVATEYIRWLQAERAKINNADLADIEFYENGQVVVLPDGRVEDFKMTGMNNIDFITSGYYKDD